MAAGMQSSRPLDLQLGCDDPTGHAAPDRRSRVRIGKRVVTFDPNLVRPIGTFEGNA